jgi:uncharacterized membrane protein YgaE (UPF0421/DUF939 family)
MMAAAMDRSTTSARASRLLDDAASRGRSGAQSRVDALRVVAPAIVQTALAAALAWLAGTELVGHDAPFLAPIAAIITLGTTYGQRTRRAVEIALGVALGVLISELVVLSLGTGPLQIALVVALAMTAAVVLGGGRLLVTQAGTAACLIATVGAPDSITLERAVDALCGGAAGLVVGLVLLPIDPLRLARRWREPLLEELRGVLDDVREALAATDHDAAVDALARARGLDPLAARHLEATTVGGEIGRGSPLRRRALPALAREAQGAAALDLAVRNVRVLARGAVRAVDLEAHLPRELPQALEELSRAVELLPAALEDPARHTAPARDAALRAAGLATVVLEQTSNLAASVIVGQVRSLASDLVGVLGMTADEARDAVRRAAAEAARKAAQGPP